MGCGPLTPALPATALSSDRSPVFLPQQDRLLWGLGGCLHQRLQFQADSAGPWPRGGEQTARVSVLQLHTKAPPTGLGTDALTIFPNSH